VRDSPVYRIGNFVFFFALEEKLWVWTFRICLIQIWYIGCATKGLYLLVSWEIDNTEAVVSEQAEGRVLQLEMHLLPSKHQQTAEPFKQTWLSHRTLDLRFAAVCLVCPKLFHELCCIQSKFFRTSVNYHSQCSRIFNGLLFADQLHYSLNYFTHSCKQEEAPGSAAGNEWPIAQHSGFKDSSFYTRYKMLLNVGHSQLGCLGCSSRWDAGQHWDVVDKEQTRSIIPMLLFVVPVHIPEGPRASLTSFWKLWDTLGVNFQILLDTKLVMMGSQLFQLCFNWMCSSFNHAPFKYRWHAARSAIILKSSAFWFALIVFCLQKSVM